MRKPLSSRVKQKIAQWYADREERTYYEDIEQKVEKRKKSRLRLWECAECRQKIRAASDTLNLICGSDGNRFELKTIVLSDPFGSAKGAA